MPRAADSFWAGWAAATCMPDACFCEAVRGGLIAQPANTWSNLAFVLVGALILTQGRRPLAGPGAATAGNLLSQHAAYSLVYGTAAILMGLGSLFFHASLTFAGQFFDVGGMYLVGVFVLLYNLARLFPLSRGLFVGAYVILNLVLGYTLIAAPAFRRWLFGALLAAALAAEFALRRRRPPTIDARWLWAAVASMAAALTIWTLDLRKIVCAPHSLAQGHALWHLLCAVAVGCLYLYYRSERTPPSAL